MGNIDVALLHFKRIGDKYKGVISAREVNEILNIVKHCDKNRLKLIALGFHVYVGDTEFADLETSQMFEGGFAVEQ